jgi:hypothetical protein
MKYRQCQLQKGEVIDVAWIPVKFAVVGKFLRIKDDNCWEVKSVGSQALEEDALLTLRDNHRSHRMATDVR